MNATVSSTLLPFPSIHLSSPLLPRILGRNAITGNVSGKLALLKRRIKGGGEGALPSFPPEVDKKEGQKKNELKMR